MLQLGIYVNQTRPVSRVGIYAKPGPVSKLGTYPNRTSHVSKLGIYANHTSPVVKLGINISRRKNHNIERVALWDNTCGQSTIMADSGSEDETATIAHDIVVTKYKMAGEIVNSK